MFKNIFGSLFVVLVCGIIVFFIIENQSLKKKISQYQETQVSEGSMFIVTKGSENVKLGAVKIYVYPIHRILEFFASIKNELELDSEKLPTIKANLQQLELEILTSVPQKVLKEKLNIGAICKWKIYVPFSDTAHSLFSDECDKKKLLSAEELCKYYGKQIVLCGNFNTLKNKVLMINFGISHPNSPLNYFLNLPEPSFVVETDADGKFKVNFPQKGVYAIVALAQRSIGEKDEKYYWAVKHDSNLSNVINLTNNNLSSTGSSDSLIKTEDQ
jgi:hypothetical protein